MSLCIYVFLCYVTRYCEVSNRHILLVLRTEQTVEQCSLWTSTWDY